MNKRTKIICTIGPASESQEVLEKLMEAGMNVARLNFSHGSYENHSMLIENIQTASKNTGKTVTIMQDLQGPKIRLGEFEGELELKKGDTVILSEAKDLPLEKEPRVYQIPVSYKDLQEYLQEGTSIFMVDGLIEVMIEKIEGKNIFGKVMNGGKISSHKGINIPDAKKNIASLTEKDKKDLEFGIQKNVDYVALSFAQSAGDVKELRKLMQQHEAALPQKRDVPTKILVKIEKKQALENLKEIVAEADAVMIARGDLGIETPLKDVPVVQKEIAEYCRIHTKPVIVATQMLESMIKNPRPTRAEVSDVANAVVDHVDAVMLSAESAVGKYPVEAVQIMAQTIADTEKSRFDDLENESQGQLPENVAVAKNAAQIAQNEMATAILIATFSETTLFNVVKYRPETKIVFATESEQLARQSVLAWGVLPLVVKKSSSMEAIMQKAIDQKILKKDDRVVVVTSEDGDILNEADTIHFYKA